MLHGTKREMLDFGTLSDYTEHRRKEGEYVKYEKVDLIKYTKGEELCSVITHLIGLILCHFILQTCVLSSFFRCDLLMSVSSVAYFTGTLLTFVFSVLYHAARPGKAKKTLRLLDHCGVFLAVSGTAAGCAPAVRDTVGLIPAMLMICFAVLGAAGGLVLTIRDFEKTRNIRMSLYFITAVVCAACGAGAYFRLPVGAFLSFLFGSLFLLIGSLFLRFGKKVRYLHPVFHVFVLLGLSWYYYGISSFCY